MTDLDPAALRALGDAATEAPWSVLGERADGSHPVVVDLRVGGRRWITPGGERPEDSAFIAAARNSWDALLDRVEAQGREIERPQRAAAHPFKGPNDTDASMLRNAARRIEQGYAPGGQHTTSMTVRVLRVVADLVDEALRPSVSAPTSPDGEG